MKKQTVIIVISLVAILGVLGGYFFGRSHSKTGGKVVTVLRYSELPNLVTVIERVEPMYPQSALRDKVEGTVRLRVMVGTDGSATSAEVVKSVREDLDKAAKEAVMAWKFAKIMYGDKPVSGPALVSIDFKLDGSKVKK